MAPQNTWRENTFQELFSLFPSLGQEPRPLTTSADDSSAARKFSHCLT